MDDASSDNRLSIARLLEQEHSVTRVFRRERNQGKGAALRTGFSEAVGNFVAVQDADLEYDPMDLKGLLVPMISGNADVAIGSRFLSTGVHRVLYYWHSIGNRILTFLSKLICSNGRYENLFILANPSPLKLPVTCRAGVPMRLTPRVQFLPRGAEAPAPIRGERNTPPRKCVEGRRHNRAAGTHPDPF